MPPEAQARLIQRFGRKYSAGQVIFQETDPGAECFILQEGRVRLVKRVRLVEKSLLILRPGDLFGESALLESAPRTSTAVAMTDVVLLALDAHTFETLMTSDSAVALRLVRLLVRRVREAEDQIENMLLRDNQSKIVNTLLKLCDERAATGQSPVFSLSPIELSSRVGLDVDAVKRGVAQLRDAQYLVISEEQITISDMEALRGLYRLLGMKEELRR